MQVILDSFFLSSFARPGSTPIWGGKKGEFRDWTNFDFDFSRVMLFLSCCTASLVMEAACQSESYDYIYEGKRNLSACLAHCVTHAASCLIQCQF